MLSFPVMKLIVQELFYCINSTTKLHYLSITDVLHNCYQMFSAARIFIEKSTWSSEISTLYFTDLHLCSGKNNFTDTILCMHISVRPTFEPIFLTEIFRQVFPFIIRHLLVVFRAIIWCHPTNLLNHYSRRLPTCLLIHYSTFFSRSFKLWSDACWHDPDLF